MRFARIRDWLPEILFVVLTTAAGVWAHARWMNPIGDPGAWWSLLGRMMRGERIYRDIFLQYGPLTPSLLGLAARVFGLSTLSFLLFNWVPAIILGALLLRAARPFFTMFERLAVLALVVALGAFGMGLPQSRLIFCYCPAAVQALALSVGALLVLRCENVRWTRALAVGALAGLAFCAKQEIGLAALVGLCVSLLIGSRPTRLRVLPCVGAFVVVAGAGIAWTLGAAPLGSLRQDSHLWPFGTPPPVWNLIFLAATGMGRGWAAQVALSAIAVAAIALALGRAALARTAGGLRGIAPILVPAVLLATGLAVWARSTLQHWNPLRLSMLVALAVSAAALLDRSFPKRDFVVGFSLFAGIVAARTAFAESWNPYSSVANASTALTWPLFLFRVVPGIFPGGRGLAERGARALWLGVVLVAGGYVAVQATIALRNPAWVTVGTPQGPVYAPPDTAAFLSTIGRRVHAGERALVLPESNGVEALFCLKSVSPLLLHMPGWLDGRAEELLLQRLSTEPPDVVILFPRSNWEFGVAPFGEGFGRRLAAWVNLNYRIDGREMAGGKILRRKNSA